MFPDLTEASDGYRFSNQAIIHHLKNFTQKKPTQSRFEIEEEYRDAGFLEL